MNQVITQGQVINALKMCQIEISWKEISYQSYMHEEVKIGECLLAFGVRFFAFEIFWKHER